MQFKDGDLAIGFYSRTPYVVVSSTCDSRGKIVVVTRDSGTYNLVDPEDLVIDPQQKQEMDLADEIQVIKDRLDDIDGYITRFLGN